MFNIILHFNKGFTLLELLITIAVISVISVVGFGFYSNYNRNVEIDSVSRVLVSDLKLAQSNSMSGVDGFKWGIHLVNGTDDYYELFSTPTNYSDSLKSVSFKKYLSDGINFSTPGEGSNIDVIFDKISGRTSTSSISLSFSEIIKTINISSLGSISF